MASKYPKQTKTIKLDLSEIPRNNRARVKKEIGDFVVNEILFNLGDGKSPVANRGKFKKLNKDYAKDEKGGDTNPNLELDGDMLDALTSQNRKGDIIEVGIFKAKEQGKADGHNNFSGKSKLPTRRFIPSERENFKRSIDKGIKQIISDNKQIRQPEQDETIIPLEEDIFNINIDDVLGRSFFDEFGI